MKGRELQVILADKIRTLVQISSFLTKDRPKLGCAYGSDSEARHCRSSAILCPELYRSVVGDVQIQSHQVILALVETERRLRGIARSAPNSI